jgi:hypothetical protein
VNHETSKTYSNSIEALYDLLNSYSIAHISTYLSHLANGVEYSFVEVTCNNGTQYGIQAYAKEALELNRVASKIIHVAKKAKEEVHPIVIF